MKLLYWLPAFFWAGVIFYLSGRSGSQLQSMFPFFSGFDWGHVAAYFILSLLVAYALEQTVAPKRFKLWVLLICFFYGLSDEIHQHFVPGRTPEWTDLANDVLGAFLALLIYPGCRACFKKEKAGQEP
ncbi:MAG TPA: VanZ family protein [Clostridia bacterium]|jgi:VanZ family protein|nr:VanZ family protein [Clostridia bacterium]